MRKPQEGGLAMSRTSFTGWVSRAYAESDDAWLVEYPKKEEKKRRAIFTLQQATTRRETSAKR